jgi:hypothetical protein
MDTIPHIATALRTVLTEVAEQAARATGAVRRQRKFSGAQLVQTLVFGFLDNPSALTADWVDSAHAVGVDVSAQAISARCTLALAATLERVLSAAVQQVVSAEPVALPILARFSQVYIHDSTTIVLPEQLASFWAGCGGSPGAANTQAALKLQLRLELRHGTLSGPILQAGRAHDRQVCHLPRPARGALRLADLGYWNLDDRDHEDRDGRFWLLRYKLSTCLYDANGKNLELLPLLQTLGEAPLDMPVQLGKQQRLRCRLLAQRVDPQMAARRRAEAERAAADKGEKLSAMQLALFDWTIAVTNAPQVLLSASEALILIHIRWQIEIFVRLWKDEGKVDEWCGERPERVLCEVYAKLIALIIQHWLVLTQSWQYVDRSLVKCLRTIRKYALELATAVQTGRQLEAVLRRIQSALAATDRMKKRKQHPNTFQELLSLSANR